MYLRYVSPFLIRRFAPGVGIPGPYLSLSERSRDHQLGLRPFPHRFLEPDDERLSVPRAFAREEPDR